jgi:hypothetical protein
VNDATCPTGTITPTNHTSEQSTGIVPVITPEAIAANAVKSGVYKGLTQSTAMMIVQISNELGIPPAQGLGSIHIVQGKLVLSANLLAALVQRSGRFRYRVLENSDKVCAIEFLEKVDGQWDKLGVFRFTLEMAKRAELLGKSVWRQYPEAMLFSRAMTAGVRMFCPSLCVVACYSPEEAEAFSEPVVRTAEVRTPRHSSTYSDLAKEVIEAN